MAHSRRQKIRNKPATHSSRIQAEIADEAGRIMADEGVQDFRQAKLKARDRLKAGKDVPLPSNQEIQLARDKHIALFTPHEQILAQRHKMMEIAAEAMEFLQHFKPRLVADFLNHPVSSHTIIELHLQASGPEALAHFLIEQAIPFEQQEKLVHFGSNTSITVPALNLQVDDQLFRLVLFTETQHRQTPRDLNGKGAQYRINQKQVSEWLALNQQG